MELLKAPFHSESFLNHRSYREERENWLKNQYVGKTMVFNCELIGLSGSTRHNKGDKVICYDMNVDCFKLTTVDGEKIHGLFKPSCLELETTQP
jgi:hypothetical protein